MNMESILNVNLEMYPDVVDMLEGVSVGDVVKVTASFQVKELSEKKFTGAFEDKEGIKITADESAESEDDTDEEEPESEETPG